MDEQEKINNCFNAWIDREDLKNVVITRGVLLEAFQTGWKAKSLEPSTAEAAIMKDAEAYLKSLTDPADVETEIIMTGFTLQALDRQRAEIADKMETIRNSGGHRSPCTSTGHSLLCQIDTYIKTLRGGGGK